MPLCRASQNLRHCKKGPCPLQKKDLTDGVCQGALWYFATLCHEAPHWVQQTRPRSPGEMSVTCKATLPQASQPSAPWRQLRHGLRGPLQSCQPSRRGVGPEAVLRDPCPQADRCATRAQGRPECETLRARRTGTFRSSMPLP